LSAKTTIPKSRWYQHHRGMTQKNKKLCSKRNAEKARVATTTSRLKQQTCGKSTMQSVRKHHLVRFF